MAEAPGGGVEDARAADHGVHDAAPAHAGFRDHRACLRGGSADDVLRAARAVAGIAASGNRAGQVRDRDANPRSPDVDAHDVVGGSVGLVEHRGAAARGRRWSHRPHQADDLELRERLRDRRLRKSSFASQLRTREGTTVAQPLHQCALVERAEQSRCGLDEH